ncbi:hypothetical protein HQ590_07510 [bacterium]|nr:hypothetical protein [bacterium]
MNARRWVAAGIVILMVLVAVAVLVWMSGLFNIIPRVYRVNAKLLVSRSPLVLEPDRPIDDGFFETQIALLTNRTIQVRTRQRLKRTPVEVSQLLSHLGAARLGRTDIIVVSAESTSRDFAREFINTLADEYRRLRDEQGAQTTEAALLTLTREINRFSQELKSCDERIRAYVKEHGEAPESPLELQEMRADFERLRKYKDALLDKLLQIDTASSLGNRRVTILEPALVEPKPCGWAWR